MADPRDCSVLSADAVTTVPEVIERLTQIRDCTGKAAPECGISFFSDLYLTITQSIWAHIGEGSFFADNKYLARLDVVFANRYFDALRAWADGTAAPKAWQVLFDAPTDSEIHAALLAGAGVNAHINLDLAVATVDTGREMGDSDLEKGVCIDRDVLVSRLDDYVKINAIFAEHMDALLSRLLEQPDSDPDHLSFIGWMMSGVVSIARKFAWVDAEDLWPLPRRSDDWAAKETDMDSDAWHIGRRLLTDLPDWLPGPF